VTTTETVQTAGDVTTPTESAASAGDVTTTQTVQTAGDALL
jgi:hypothetical protein